MLKRITLILLLMMAGVQLASAQSYVPERPKSMLPRVSGSSGIATVLEMPKAPSASSSTFKNYTDEDLDEFNRRMEEREWGSEDTAWNRACQVNSRQGYEKYVARFPYGAHIAEAEQRLIAAKIAETLSNAHNDLPDIIHVEIDDESVTSTILIHNNTAYPLSVYYSGSETKCTVISVSGSATLTVENGEYKIAASVPPQHIRPYAGKTVFAGGRYEIGFWVVGE